MESSHLSILLYEFSMAEAHEMYWLRPRLRWDRDCVLNRCLSGNKGVGLALAPDIG